MNYAIYFYEVLGIAIFGIASLIVSSMVFASLSFALGFLFKPRNVIKEKEIENVIKSTSSKKINENKEDEEEIIAVITSAICAYTGKDLKSFRIKSIKERKQSAPIWAMAARLYSKKF